MLNFLLVLIVGLLLTPTDFSIFIIVFAAGSLIFSIGSGFFSQPILVYLNVDFKEDGKFYISKLTFYSFVTTGLLSIIVLSILNCFFINISFSVFLTSMLYFISWNHYEILRKYSITTNEINNKSILKSTSVFLSCFILGASILYVTQKINVALIFLDLFFAYTISIFYFYVLTKGKYRKNNNLTKLIFSNHFNYGKWSIGGLIFFWGYTQGYFIISANSLSELEMSSIRTTMNLVSLLTIFTQIYENKKIPELSEEIFIGKLNPHEIKNKILSMYKENWKRVLFLLVITYVFSRVIYSIFYREKFLDNTEILLLFITYQFLLVLTKPLIVYFKSTMQNRVIFLAHLNSFISLMICFLLSKDNINLLTAVYPLIISIISFTLTLFIKFKKHSRGIKL